MSTVAVRGSNHTTSDVAIPELVGPAVSLVEWARKADLVHGIAQRLATTNFVPASLKGKPDDVAAAILAGDELGMQPMAALRSIDVIQGTPALRAHAMRALVQSHGHDIEIVEADEQRCVMRGRRKGAKEWQARTWDLDRAKRMGLTDKAEWKKQPGTMLIARATGEIARLIAADVLYAMPYASEEIDPDPVQATATVGAKVTAADIIRQDVGEPAPAAPEPQRVSVPITAPQQKKLHALLKERGLGDRDLGLAWISQTVTRDIESTKELTKAEAGDVIDALEKLVELGEDPVAPDEPTLDADDWPPTAPAGDAA